MADERKSQRIRKQDCRIDWAHYPAEDENGNPYTAHTNNEVPFCLVTPEKIRIKDGGRLSDVAPTILKLLNIEKPKLMTGEALF